MSRASLVALAIAGAALLAGCDGNTFGGGAAKARAGKAAESPDEFIARVNREFVPVTHENAAAGWTQQTNITVDTELLNSKSNERYLGFLAGAIGESRKLDASKGTPATQRAFTLLQRQSSDTAPYDAAQRAEFTELLSRMGAMYGEAKECTRGPEQCRNIDELTKLFAKSRDYDELLAGFTGWHDAFAPMREKYQRFVELSNQGARDLGYADTGAYWRGGYDMSPEDFEKEAARLWSQVKPLYSDLQCFARQRLAAKYGGDKVPAGKPIPAHLLGNMWAQQWNNIYGDILKPYPDASIESADRELVRQKWDAQRMTRSAEGAYTSIGFPALPQVFWDRSMFTRPRDREVVCHASAWDMDDGDDVRIKMCMQPTEEDLITVYHELGHIYYYIWYKDQPLLFQGGGHDGFHEAIGDTVNLSVTPAYLHSIGLVSAVKPSHEALINQQMKMAADKIAFLPFGKLIDEWRWKVFSGQVTPEHYNEAWWQLRREYQGIAPAVARTEAGFDPGAKYHIPGNTPYTRYFLSFIIQFQFQKGLCEAAGFKGPLHECSIFGSKEAGEKFAEMLKLGQSEPWQVAFEKVTGTRQMDAGAILEYFAPLREWLAEANQGQTCGWEG